MISSISDVMRELKASEESTRLAIEIKRKYCERLARLMEAGKPEAVPDKTWDELVAQWNKLIPMLRYDKASADKVIGMLSMSAVVFDALHPDSREKGERSCDDILDLLKRTPS